MLTRFEVSGFKNLRDVVVDFGSFTCIAGQNGVGKSNLFDAIQFMSHLASGTFREAIAAVRLAEGQRATQDSVLSEAVLAGEENLRLAAEVILRPGLRLRSGLRESEQLTDRYLRYEVELAVDTSYKGARARPIRLASERLVSCGRTARRLVVGPMHLDDRDMYITTFRFDDCDEHETNEEDYIVLHDQGYKAALLKEGGAVVPDVYTIAKEREQTVLSAAMNGTLPHAVAEEMRSWRFMALEPGLIRAADDKDEEPRLAGSGAHLPALLASQVEARGERAYEDLRLALLGLLDLRGLEVQPNGDFLELRAQVGDGPVLPARALSDGTLRMLVFGALATASQYSGAVFIEEPENGVHPGLLHHLLDLLRLMAQDRDDVPRQVVINTHSPYLVQDVIEDQADDVLCAVRWRRKEADGRTSESVTFNPLPGTWRAQDWKLSKDRPRASAPVSASRLVSFLSNPLAEVDRDE